MSTHTIPDSLGQDSSGPDSLSLWQLPPVGLATKASDPLQVLVVTPKGVVGGAERWLLGVLGGTRRLSVTVLALDDGPLLEELAARGIPALATPLGRGVRDGVTAGWVIARELRRRPYEAVLANGVKAAALSLAPARAVGVPVVFVQHDQSFSESWGRAALRYSARTITVTPPEPAADEPSERPRATFIAPPLLAEPLSPAAAGERLGDLGVPCDGRPLVAMFTRLVPHKGVDRLIEALARPGGQTWRAVIIGGADPAEPTEAARLGQVAARAGVADRVSFLGEVPQAGRLAAAFTAVAVLTRPEPGYPAAEGFGLTVAEAMAAGTPVLGDPATVPPLRLDQYREGAVQVNGDDPAAIATGLAVLADPQTHQRLSDAARVGGSRHPRAGQVADEVAEVLAEAADRPGAGRASGPAFSVIATVFNEGPAVDELCAGVLPQLGPSDEFVIVDGGSTDDTTARVAAISSRDERVRLVESPGAGISAGRNIAVRHARNDWIAATDAGCHPDPRWLAELRAAASTGEFDLVTGTYRADPGNGPAWEAALAAVGYPDPAEWRRTPWRRAYARLFGRAFDPNLPTGRSVAFRKHAWELAGGYPEDLATAEDVLFGKRAVQAGARVAMSRAATVTWRQRPTLSANLRMFRGYGRGDGQSADPQLVARDAIRAAAYGLGPLLLIRRSTRPVAVLGAAAYFSQPIARTLRGPRPVAATLLVPGIAAARDLAKARGCWEGLLNRSRTRDQA